MTVAAFFFGAGVFGLAMCADAIAAARRANSPAMEKHLNEASWISWALVFGGAVGFAVALLS